MKLPLSLRGISMPAGCDWSSLGRDEGIHGYRVKIDTSRRYKPRPLAVPAIFDRGVRRSSTG
jgi:hypothetical protein